MTSFLELFRQLQHFLGDAALPLELTAQRPQKLILSQALYPELGKEAAIAIYKSNCCRSMLDPVRLYPTLNALGALKRTVSQRSNTDVDSISFIEDIGRAATRILPAPGDGATQRRQQNIGSTGQNRDLIHRTG